MGDKLFFLIQLNFDIKNTDYYAFNNLYFRFKTKARVACHITDKKCISFVHAPI